MKSYYEGLIIVVGTFFIAIALFILSTFLRDVETNFIFLFWADIVLLFSIITLFMMLFVDDLE